jgi:PAS domain S-box-containing protein
MGSFTEKRVACAAVQRPGESSEEVPANPDHANTRLGLNKQGLTTPTRVVILTAFYFVGGMIGNAGAFMGGDVALVSPPAGIALAAILLFGYRFLPGVALGAVLFSLMNGKPLGYFTLGTAIGNSVGAMVCVYLLERFVQFRNPLDRIRDVVGFVLFAATLGTTVNAAFNVTSLCLSGEIAWDNFASSLAAWWVPNAMGTLVVTPFLLSWCTGGFHRWEIKRIVEAVLCGAGLTLATMVSLNSWYVYGIQNYPLAYLPYPFLIWGALRFGQRGATTGTLLVACLAIHASLHHKGPFVMQTERESLILIGSYIGVLAVTNMLLAAAALEREKTQQKVRESEARVRAILTDGIFTLSEVGRIESFNPAAERIFGYDAHELAGRNLKELLHESARDEYDAYVIKYVRPETTRNIELHGKHKDGTIFPIDVAVNEMVFGTERRLIALVRDISESKGLEEQLRQSQKLESVGLLANSVAHDFNNLLTVIQGHSSLMLAAKNLPPQLADCANEIAIATERAGTFTRQLLAFSRRRVIRTQSFDLNDALDNMTSMLRRVLGDDIALTMDLDKNLPSIEGDTGLVEQLVRNLAMNAREAMPKGGKFSLATSVVRIDEEYVQRNPGTATGPHICLTIRDTGCGIRSEHLSRVFEPFFTTKAASKGAGLGLATVYGIVKQHQGWIKVTSVVGEGTTFHIYFPIPPEKNEE